MKSMYKDMKPYTRKNTAPYSMKKVIFQKFAYGHFHFVFDSMMRAFLYMYLHVTLILCWQCLLNTFTFVIHVEVIFKIDWQSV